MIEVNKYNHLKIEEYNGTYSLVTGWISREGEWKPNFVTEKFGAKGEKNVPKRIPLGDSKEAALQTLERLMEDVTHGGDEPPF